MLRQVLTCSLLVTLLHAGVALASSNSPPSPLFIDPNYHGSCDPEIIWNPAEKQFQIFYTARRATRERATYVATPIGVATSPDLKVWTFRGYCDFTDSPDVKHVGAPDMPVTFWAPAVVRSGEQLHMFVTHKRGTTPPWGGRGEIRHYVTPANDPLSGWKLVEPSPKFTEPDPIDATIIRDDANDRYVACFRVARGGPAPAGIHWATSRDLITWEPHGLARGDVNVLGKEKFSYQEAPYLFRFNEAFWLITDAHKGLPLYRSTDGVEWTYQTTLLDKPGKRESDGTLGRHPSVLVAGGRAFLFYHVEPNRTYGPGAPGPEARTVEQKKSVLQMCELTVDGDSLRADRDADIELPTLEQLQVTP